MLSLRLVYELYVIDEVIMNNIQAGVLEHWPIRFHAGFKIGIVDRTPMPSACARTLSLVGLGRGR